MTKPRGWRFKQGARGYSWVLGHQGAGDDIGRDRRRCRNHVDKSGLCDWQLHLYRHFRRHRRRADFRGGIPSVPVLGRRSSRRQRLGTTMADFADRSLGIGYSGGSLILFAGLIASLAVWRWSEGSISVNTVATPEIEIFYWVAILFSQTLGTALGDWMADTNGFGYEGGAVVFAAGLAVVAVAYFYTKISHTSLFWAAFILTRPLGATLGDLLDKPHENGGLEFSRYVASGILAVIIVVADPRPPATGGGASRRRRAERVKQPIVLFL